MAKIIILNAPPGSGKDTIGREIYVQTGGQVKLLSFKAPMFEIARAMLGNKRYEMFLKAYEDRKRKESPQAFLNGKTPREFMIWISEDVIKPAFGSGYFGIRLGELAKDAGRDVVVTDGGFEREVVELIALGHEVKLCRLHRDGFTFAGDSRDYVSINPGWYGVNGYEESDYKLFDGEPLPTAQEIITKYNLGESC